MAQQKLKILALHGYRQSGPVFKGKTGSFRKIVQKYADFIYITGPHKVVDEFGVLEDVESVETDQYSWWFNRNDVTFKGDRQGGPAIGFGESLQLIEKAYEELGPFDGILGFSQGACFVGLILYLQNRCCLKTNFKFAIVAAGFCSGSLPHKDYYDDILTIPSLHIYGTNDKIITPEMSEKLATVFEEEKRIEVLHSGGHFFPASSQQKQQYIDFMRDMLISKLEEQELERPGVIITTDNNIN